MQARPTFCSRRPSSNRDWISRTRTHSSWTAPILLGWPSSISCAGYSIAMRDLEIRGAGELLGTRQHGHIQAVGFHLYTRLLADAVRRLRAAKGQMPKANGQDSTFRLSAFDLPIAMPVNVDLP